MATSNSAGTLGVSGHGRVHVGNIYNTVPEPAKTPSAPSFNIPFRRDDDFVNRKIIMDQLHHICLRPASRAALVGLGGVGKSQLAIEHAYRMRDRFKQEDRQFWAFWVHASTRARVEEDFKRIADIAEVPGRNQSGVNILQLVYQWLQNERIGQWLMVLDSADDLDVFYDINNKGKQKETTKEQKRPLWTYLPQSSNGSILVTTRSGELASRLTGNHKNMIEVGSMDRAHALELLAARSGSQYDNEDGLKLVEALECMPLAISQAAAYIQERAPRVSVKTYLDKFQRNEENQSSLLNYDSGDLRRDGSASNSVIITWQISFDYIRSIRPSATNLLSLMSFFDSQGIFDYLIQPMDLDEQSDDEAHSDNESTTSSLASNPEFEEDIRILRSYCLIKTNEAGDVFEMHGLVQLSTRKWLDLHGETEAFKEQYIDRMANAFPYPEFENWGICRQLLPHAEKIIHYRPNENETLIKWAIVLHHCAEAFLTCAQEVEKTTLGLENECTLHSIQVLAIIYWHQEQFPKAESLLMQVLEINKRVLGSEHLDTLTTINNLTSVYYYQERLREAELLQSQLLETYKKVLGAEHRNALTTMKNLAITYKRLGRLEESESLLLQVLELEERVFGSEHPDTLWTLGWLANVHYAHRRLEKCEILELQVLEIGKRILGLEHPDTLGSMHNLACTWKEQGRVHEAIELMEKCYQLRTRVMGSEDPKTQRSLSTLQDWLVKCARLAH
ncbi:P-loop containing nucleoside triphosphate hydrolase protein [Xylaria bambusicola]|uniref:P-loop containing nucleoside triphosphate hydrolase protein n=1 Tax=Xylaria bambusicola TaxID=326684 RepID=UPI002008D5A2|nr:P-loop containing nucleoside triphosphate hydrolase protein [Xylaria bambusicola]KAI0513162.1 P-loop containing nucleoside triphosphate hydrolase protein [Xylaria bambusicola]